MRTTIKSIIAATAFAISAAGAAGQCLPQQTAVLKSATLASDDAFGTSVAVSGSVAAVGIPYDDDRGTASGSVAVFRQAGTAWNQEALVLASDGSASDAFGSAVAINGQWLFVGAPMDDDLNGVPSGMINLNTGSVYVYRWVNNSWQQQPYKLYTQNAYNYDQFGSSIATDGLWTVVGTPKDSGNTGAGAAYVYKNVNNIWTFIQKLNASDVEMGNGFGTSVSLSGTRIAVGDPFDDDGIMNSGSAYVFELVGTTWVERAKLRAAAPMAVDQFGASVAVSADRVVVGAPFDDTSRGADSGSVYAYRLNQGVWAFDSLIIGNDGMPSDNFGSSVGLSSSQLVIGARRSDVQTWDAGAGYSLQVTSSGGIAQQTRMAMSAANTNDYIGAAVAVSGDTAFVGVPGSEQYAINGGLARVFVRPACGGTTPDTNGDGVVNVNDLLSVINQWGTCPPTAPCSGDVVVNGQVDVNDLLAVINAWG